MNCVNVQEAIWCGELTQEMQQHIATCEDCQGEQRKIQELSFSLEHVQVPAQSRSLLPSKEEIEQTLRARKRKAFTKWGVTSVAAAACVVAAILVLPSWLHSNAPSNNAIASISPKQTSTDRTPPTADMRTGPTDPKDKTSAAPPAIRKEPSVATAESSSTSPQRSAQPPQTFTDSQQPTADQPYVTVADGIDPKFAQLAEEIKGAETQTFDTTMFRHITIEKMEQDTQNSDATNLEFVVTLFVQHQQGKGSAYGTGDVTTQRFAHFTNHKGMWDFDGLATTPVSLKKNDTHEVFVKNNNTPVATFSIPSYLDAQNNADGSVTLMNQGKVMGSLEIEMQKPHDTGNYSDAVSLPNGAQVVNQQTLSNGTAIHIIQYTLTYDAPNGGQAATGTRVYFMRDDKVAYDLSFPEGAISADLLQQIVQSFNIIMPAP